MNASTPSFAHAQRSDAGPTPQSAGGFRIVVTPSGPSAGTARDGRLLVVISTDSSGEPRMQMSDHDNTQQVFGIDVHGLSATKPGVFDARVFGYPKVSLADVPAGGIGSRPCSTPTRCSTDLTATPWSCRPITAKGSVGQSRQGRR